MNRRLAGRFAASCLVVFMLATTFNTVYATTYEYNLSQATATVRTPTVQLQPGTAGSSTVSNGVYATVTVSASAMGLYYVPVTLTNSASSATPNPFQVMIQPNPSTYSTYEASDLGNIGFCMDALCTSKLYSWLEGCGTSAPYGACSTASTLATFWVELTSVIAASGGTLTIYMVFFTSTEFDGIYRGEAPQLSTTYAAYDNGANVFSAYFNGNTKNSSCASWCFSVHSGDTLAQVTGISGPGGTTINVIQVTGSTGNHLPAFSFNKAMSNTAQIAESSFSLAGDTGSATGAVGLVDNAAVKSIQNGITAQMGYSSSYFSQAYELAGAVTLAANGYSGTYTQNWVYASVTYTGTCTSCSSWSAYIAPQLYSSTGGYSGTVTNNPLSTATNIYLGQISGTLAIDVYYNWFRARAYPPSNTMPSASFGSVASIAANGVILTFKNSGSSSWLANLAVVGKPSGANHRLTNLTISFTSPLSKQVILGTGVTNQTSGPQVTLAASSTLSIVMGVTVSSSGTSGVTLALKIQNPPSPGSTSVYCYDIISLTVN